MGLDREGVCKEKRVKGKRDASKRGKGKGNARTKVMQGKWGLGKGGCKEKGGGEGVCKEKGGWEGGSKENGE